MEDTLFKFVQHSIWTTVHIHERRIAPKPVLQSGNYKKGIGNVKVKLFLFDDEKVVWQTE